MSPPYTESDPFKEGRVVYTGWQWLSGTQADVITYDLDLLTGGAEDSKQMSNRCSTPKSQPLPSWCFLSIHVCIANAGDGVGMQREGRNLRAAEISARSRSGIYFRNSLH